MIYLLPHIIDRTAERLPENEAFRFNGEGLTYAALVRRSNQLARVLVEQGVRRGDRVGIYLHKNLETAVALYGIMKAGAAYVPLDPLLPAARLASILTDCNLRCLITQPAKLPQITQLVEQGARLDCLVGLTPPNTLPLPTISWSEVETAPEAAIPGDGLMEQDMAYLMYTSGSTGAPKGMIHTHASGLAYAQLAAAVYDLQPEDRLSNFPPLHFDQSTFDYFSGPLAGATTVIIPDEVTKFPASLSKLMQDERLTVWYSVPFALVQLLLRGVLEQRDLSNLRWVLFGGEPFPAKHLRALMQQWLQARFSNVYGPAEINQCTFYHVPPLAADSDKALPIGPLWPNAEGLVLDEDDHSLPPGEIGELVVRTPTMMQGYWNRPDLNLGAFYYREREGGRGDKFYRTGDLVRLGPDGNYHFLGRKDRQVKARGYRIELDEVEAALLTHPQIVETAVYPVPEIDGTQQIHASVILKPGSEVLTGDLRKHLSSRLPRYALPAQVEFVSQFPRTSSGKIDRRRLQAEAAIIAVNRDAPLLE
jgi:amino acid adenylation domain-containing protein